MDARIDFNAILHEINCTSRNKKSPVSFETGLLIFDK
jgi:hypothetical protein